MKSLNTTFIVFCVICLLSGCSKDEKVNPCTINTLDPSDVTRSTAICGGDVTSDGDGKISERGICYSSSGEPSVSDSKISTTGDVGKFTVKLQGLKLNTVYFFKAYSINEAGVSYGNVKSFTTFPIPEMKNIRFNDITMTSCECFASLTVDFDIIEAGFCYGTELNPTIYNNYVKTYEYFPFTAELKNLQPGTQYHVRGYAKNNFGTSYSYDTVFTTAMNDVPVVKTHAAINYTLNSVTVKGEVLKEGGPGTIRGIVWGIYSGVTLENAIGYTENGTGAGEYTGVMEGTECNETYYARAYAKNPAGVSYGDEIVIYYNLPLIFLETIDDIGGDNVTCIAEVKSAGGIPLTGSGYVWSTEPEPDLDDFHSYSLTAKITGLTENTTYYFRAYAKNMVGISYSNQKTINTGYKFGTLVGGGMVFYNDGQGHGLTCLYEKLDFCQWGCATTIGTSDSIGASVSNTLAIIEADCGSTYAGQIMDQFTAGGYSDWVIPSKRAMEKISINLAEFGLFTYGDCFWTSTEWIYPSEWVYVGCMLSCSFNAKSKYDYYQLLPIRNF